MTRLRIWAENLDALIAERMNLPFQWGGHDCCIFAADAVLACTGEDPAADLRGAYSNEMQAAKVLREYGGVGMIAENRLAFSVPASMARTGDIGLVKIAGRESLAVCTGMHWHCPGEAGLVVLGGDEVSRAWRI
jgi:hypothetical protein